MSGLDKVRVLIAVAIGSARAFVERFGGAFYKTSEQLRRRHRGSFSKIVFCGKTLRALKHEQHVLIACARITKGDERLILRQIVPGVERIHVRELDDDNALRLPMAALR